MYVVNQVNIVVTKVIEKYIGSDRTVISFSGVGNNPTGKINQEFYNLDKQGYNVLFVIDEDRSWFNNINVRSITKRIKTEKVFCLGNSMGAYNACMFSTVYPVNSVLAFAVQYSVKPDIVPWEHRWDKHVKNIKHWKYNHIDFSNNTQYLIINGEEEGDAKHLSMIPNKSNITKILHKGNHSIGFQLKKSGNLYPIINLFFKENKIHDYISQA